MTCEPFENTDIIWHYLILLILHLKLVIWNLSVMKGHTEFWEACGALLHRV